MTNNLNRVNNDLSEALLTSGRLRDLLDELKCEPRGSSGGQTFRGRCPVHGGGGANLVVGTEGNNLPIYWACHSHACHKTKKLKPTLLGLVRGALAGDAARPASVATAVTFIEKFIAGEQPQTSPRPPARTTRKAPAWTREQVRERLAIPSPYFLSRGFSPAVLDRFDIGESHRLNCAVVPIYNDTGKRCVGFLSRSTKPHCEMCNKCHGITDGCRMGEARWSFPTGFAKGDYLFNYAAASRSDAPFILLVEGVPDVLRAAEAGVVAVSGFGTDLSVAQQQKLYLLNKPVVVAFDNDSPGRAAAVGLVNMLRRGCVRAEVRHPPAEFKDVGEMPVESAPLWLAC